MRRFFGRLFGRRNEEDEEEPVEQQEEEEEDDAGNQAQENLLRLLGQLQGEAVDGEGEGNLDDIFQRLMNHLQPKASTSSIDDSPMAKLNEEMFQAVRSGDINRFQACLAQGADLRYKHPCDRKNRQTGAPKIKTCLHVAASKGHLALVKAILAKDIETTQDASPDLNRNALHYACNKKSSVAVLQALLDEGKMNVNAVSENGWLPFHYAVASSRLDMAQFLVSRGASPHAEYDQGCNVMTLAACSKNEPMVRWLLDKGVSPNTQDKQGLTPLHRLSRFGDLSMTKLLVEYGQADVTLLDNSGCSVMEEADRNNMTEIATYLWTKGCESTSVKNPDGMGPTAWFRVRHKNLPSARYGAGVAYMGTKLVLFSGLGQDIDFINHDNENHMNPDQMTAPLKDTYVADLEAVAHASIIPAGVNPARPDLTLSTMKCGKFIRLDADGLKMWSIPVDETERLHASIVTATRPFKRSDKFGYFEIHVVDGGEDRIVTIGLVDAKYPVDYKQPGWDKDSYGYHGDDGGCFHNNGAGKAWGERFNPGDVIGCGINFEGHGEVFWTKNGKFLGVSHIGPQSDEYYAAIGVENNGAIVNVNFGKTPFQFSFQVPTIHWKRTPAQDEYCCNSAKLIPLPEVGEILALPDRLNALSKVWLFNMRTLKWRTHFCNGVRPAILSSSQYVRMGDAVYVWNTEKACTEDYASMSKRTPSLYRLDLELWTWSEVLSYDITSDPTIDENLQPVITKKETDEDGSDSEEDSDTDDDSDGEEEKTKKSSKKSLKPRFYLPASEATDPETSPSEEIRGAGQESNKRVAETEKPKATPKETMASRIHHVVSLLDGDFKNSFFVAMEDELVFVAHMSMMKVNLNTYECSVSELRGTRPLITHHSSVAVGTDIVTFGGWDDRKQQNELFILDTRSKLWYKPHIGGLLFPRPRNNHSCVYFESTNPTFAIDPSEDSESSILAKHASSYFSYNRPPTATHKKKSKSAAAKSSSASNSSPSMAISAATTSSDLSDSTSTNDEGVYRFCLVAMGWNGANTMIDLDFVALDTQKRVEELGNMLEDSSASATSANGVDFDVKIEIVPTASSTADADAETSAITCIGAHKAILWARSDFFKSLLTEELVSDSTSSSTTTIRMEGSVEHVKALLKFLYTDHVNVVPLLATYRTFVKVAEKYAPNHVQRLVAEYLHTKVYEPEKLNEELGELLASGAFADVTFLVGGQSFKAHKVVLTARSSFFRALLTSGLKESHQAEIELEDCTPEEFGALLQFLYARTVDYAHISDYILGLFALANRCDARRLKTILESLIAFNLDVSNVASLLVLADQHASPTLKRSCIDFINLNPDAVQYDDPSLKAQVEQLLK